MQLAARGVSPDAPAIAILRATNDASVLEALLLSRNATPAEARAIASTAAHYVQADLTSAATATASFNAWLDADGRPGRAGFDAVVQEARQHATPAELQWLESSLRLGGFAAKAAASALLARGQPAVSPAATQPAGVRSPNAANSGPAALAPIPPAQYLQKARALNLRGVSPEAPEFKQLEAGYALWKRGG